MGFYGNLANVARTTFSFDKTYSTHFEMVLKEASDQVFVGRYVLLDYDHEDDVNDDIYKLTQLVQYLIKTDLTFNWKKKKKIDNKYRQAYTGEEITLNNDTYYILIGGDSASLQNPKLLKGTVEQTVDLEESISDWYNSHYYIDKKIFSSVGRGWDSTVWQKTYKDNDLAYVMIAELNGVVPTVDILNDPPVWLSGIEIPDENTNPDEYDKYDYRIHHMVPYFDEEDRTNLHYNLHVQSPWKFGIGDITGLPENKGDKVSLHYTKSEKDDYSYGIGKTGTAVDTIKFDFALPSIGNALNNIKDLLYGKDYYQGEQRDKPYWEENINPIHQGETIDVDENTKIFYNGITYYPDLNPGAFTSVAGALNTLYTALGSNITDSYIVKNGEKCFPEGYIYYASYAQLIGLSDVDSNYVSTEGVDTNSDNKYYWYQYNDIDNYDPKKKYRILEGYPSYNKVLLALGQQTADALDLVSNLQNLANEKVGSPGSLMFTDSDYRTGGATLVGDDAIIVNEPTYSTQRNYLPYPNWSMTSSNGGKIYGQIKENELTFTVTDKKTFTVEGTATAYTEEIIATNVYLPQGTYSFTGVPEEAANISCYLMAIKDDTDTRNDFRISSGGKAEINITSDDFYFDVVKICVDEGASFDVAVEFTPMIKLATDTSTEYIPYQNEYEINIEHKKTELDKTNELYGSSNLWTPLIDDYGHVIGINPVDLPNYYSKILLRNESQSGKVSEITLTPTKDGDLLDLTQIDGMNFRTEKEDNKTKILFRPTVDVNYIESEPIFQTEEPNINNESKWRRFPIVSGIEFSQELNSLDVRARQIPFPVSHISIASRPTLTQEAGNGQQVVTPIEFDWGSTTNPGLNGITGIYEPEYRAYTDTASNTTLPTRILTFSPADNIIKLGIWQDGSQIDPTNIADARRIIIGHGKPANLHNKNLIVGEVNNLINRQESRIPNIITTTSEDGKTSINKFKTPQEIIEYSDPITETINMTSASDSNGIFSTLSLKLDKAGHVIDMKEINVKLIWDSLVKGFLEPKAITPFTTYFYHNRPLEGKRDDKTAEEQSLIYNYGAYCVGDRIYLNEGESIYNYMFIGIRTGILGNSPGGSGLSFQWIPSAVFQKSSGNTVRVTYSHVKDVYAVSLFWSKDSSGREYFEIVGNTCIYPSYNTNDYRTADGHIGSSFQMRSTAGVRQYARSGVFYSKVAPDANGKIANESENVRAESVFATVASDKFSNPQNWKRYSRSGSAGNYTYTKVMKDNNTQYTLKDYLGWRIENDGRTYHPWERRVESNGRISTSMYIDTQEDKEYYIRDMGANDGDGYWYDALGHTLAVSTARWVGIRQFVGFGPSFANSIGPVDDVDPFDGGEEGSDEESVNTSTSDSESTYYSDGSGSGE